MATNKSALVSRRRRLLVLANLLAAHETPSLRAPAVAQELGISVSTLYAWMAEGDAPPSYKMSTRKRLWKLADVIAWKESRRTAGGKEIAGK